MKRCLVLLLTAFMLVTFFVGCSKKEEVVTETGESSDFAVNVMGNEVEDSSDLPDWTGKKLELKMWFGQGTGAGNRNKKATEDVVTPEIFRVTGVKYSEKSFDNGGELMDSKISKIIAANDWPDIVVQPERAVLQKMIDADMVWDLTELIPKYCPNIMRMLEIGGDNPYFKSDRADGKLYQFQVGPRNVTYLDPDMDPVLRARVETPVDPIGYVYVRDDILRMLYPEAKTQKEIEELYVKNGKFTKEEILDVTFNSKEEFFDFLYKIKDLGVKAGNREVYPFYVADGIDNWSLLTYLGCVHGYNMNRSSCNYFTYWDKESKQIEYMFAQPFFKEVLRDWTKLVQDDIASPDSLIDNKATFDEKVNSGQYAVLYGQSLPDANVLNAAGADYGYRKVYLNIPANSDKFLFPEAMGESNRYAILKTVDEKDLPQVLRFFDFMASKAGSKLTAWGPRSAGLFTEENGVRKFVDKELEEEAVYNAAGSKMLYYNLGNKAWPGYPACASLEQPKLVYDFEPRASMANRYFSMGTVEVPERIVSDGGDIWTFDGYGVEGVTKFWAARQAFEDAMTKIFIAKNDAEFDEYYNEMLQTAKRNGLDDATLVEINEAFEKINEKYMHNLK
ncbi:MAG: hypothetical protein IKL80_05220 [Clostridia bacterium]|nr:hypothetical protein [Clostridia bacterium]